MFQYSGSRKGLKRGSLVGVSRLVRCQYRTVVSKHTLIQFHTSRKMSKKKEEFFLFFVYKVHFCLHRVSYTRNFSFLCNIVEVFLTEFSNFPFFVQRFRKTDLIKENIFLLYKSIHYHRKEMSLST